MSLSRRHADDGLSEDAHASSDRRLPVCCGASSSIITWSIDWLNGDPSGPRPPVERLHGRNSDWTHLYNADVISMPDKWEYPWYAAWDLAFHCIPLALIDPDFAKEQLVLLLREWYMHPNGQIPAYEWAFGDVNPPVHAWAAWRVYKIEKKARGRAIAASWSACFTSCCLNFTWWVNRKDTEGKKFFKAVFSGLDNIGVFDRSGPCRPADISSSPTRPVGWAMYCLNMLAIALELARDNPAYEDVASKFFEHFVYIARAMNQHGGEDIELWDKQDGFYYDVLHLPNGESFPIESTIDGRVDSAVCGGNAGFGTDRPAAPLQAPHAMVHRKPAGIRQPRETHTKPASIHRFLSLSIATRWAKF